MTQDQNRNPLHEPDEPGEEELRRLFDATADQASGPTLTKLAARAGEVPEHAQRVPRWLPRWAWSPTLAGLAVAAGVLLVVVASRFGGPERPANSPSPAETTAAKPASSPSGAKLALTPPTSDPTSMHLGQEPPTPTSSTMRWMTTASPHSNRPRPPRYSTSRAIGSSSVSTR